ncbi:MAG: hypothetical protein A9Z00_10930 [Thermobacillus sp. ZCTH02-B1]|uniref:hypothetical protein n=1 Tax=Thermobacillus sp. ZCTH02-B1 TaxID=1858795 RepID=UPI000B549C4D|nr:hypothetical protein [Thermobacillus sp. ZCTH02-B1]OUM94676.1 MAG: hypothetical protein A9Z00_10930 [Thermobacillus sp. ZCTH02-B1]
MKEALFVVFSALETWSIFAISFTLFRFNILKYNLQIVPISGLMALLNYAIWHEIDLASWVPAIGLVLFTLFIFYTLRISLIGSLIMAATGYGSTILIQTAFLYAAQLAGFTTVAEVQAGGAAYFILSVVSSCVVIVLSLLLYRLGYGFSFPLQKFKLKRENLLILALFAAMFILLMFLHLLKDKLYFVELIAFAVELFLIFIALRKERTQW